MAKEGSIAVPTGGNITKSLKNYGVGVAAGVGFNLINQAMARFGLSGGGLISGAIAAGVTGAIVPGDAGKIITTTLGFNVGARGLGSLLSGAGGFLGGGQTSGGQSGPQFNLI